MENDRYNRDPRRNDYNTENSRYSASDDRRTQDIGNDWFREDNQRDSGSQRDGGGQRDYGSRNFYGANREEDQTYRSRNEGLGRSGYGSQGRGGYDEWSRRDTRSSGDRFPGNQGAYGAADWRRGERDSSSGRDWGSGSRDYSYGSQSGGDRWSGSRPYGGGERGYSEGGRGFWDKASDEVSSWFGDRDAERRRDMDEHRGRGPKNYSRSDDRIRDDVNDRLTDDGWIDASNIDVTVSNREVTLTGSVTDRNAKRRAEDVAESVSGVSHVQNNLRVKSNSATGTGTDVDVDRTADNVVAKSVAGGQR